MRMRQGPSAIMLEEKESTIQQKPEKAENKSIADYFGCLQINGDPLEIQRPMRDEWK